MSYLPIVLERDESRALIGACCGMRPTAVRDRALICLLWRAQLRISEALALLPSDVLIDRCTVRVRRGKGNKGRIVAIDGYGCGHLSAWLECRKKLGLSTKAPLICSMQGGRLSSSQYRQKLPRLALKAGISKRVHPHLLRHTGASELLDEGFGLLDIKEQLGHEYISTTSVYLHQINPAARIAALSRRTM